MPVRDAFLFCTFFGLKMPGLSYRRRLIIAENFIFWDITLIAGGVISLRGSFTGVSDGRIMLVQLHFHLK